jgi:hypothetical protein
MMNDEWWKKDGRWKDLLYLDDEMNDQDLLYVDDQDLLYDERWMMNDENFMKIYCMIRWMMNDEWWMMKILWRFIVW